MGKSTEEVDFSSCDGPAKKTASAEEQLRNFLANRWNFAIKKIAIEEDERMLRAKCTPIATLSPIELRTFAQAMVEAMVQAGGIGIAAPQVGITLRCFAVALSPCLEHSGEAILDGISLRGRAPAAAPEILFAANPQMLELSPDLCPGEEGCLSIPKRYGAVLRHSWIRMGFLDGDGAAHELRASGLLARCCQHENDHLDGRLFIDY
jgi:peptide deformylase